MVQAAMSGGTNNGTNIALRTFPLTARNLKAYPCRNAEKNSRRVWKPGIRRRTTAAKRFFYVCHLHGKPLNGRAVWGAFGLTGAYVPVFQPARSAHPFGSGEADSYTAT